MCDTRLLETNIPGNPQLNSSPEKTEKAVPVKQARSIVFQQKHDESTAAPTKANPQGISSCCRWIIEEYNRT